jgi:hypothetical protein
VSVTIFFRSNEKGNGLTGTVSNFRTQILDSHTGEGLASQTQVGTRWKGQRQTEHTSLSTEQYHQVQAFCLEKQARQTERGSRSRIFVNT